MRQEAPQRDGPSRQIPFESADQPPGLFEAARGGNRKAQETIVSWIRTFARHTCRHGRMRGVPELDWEDIAQEASRAFFTGAIDRFRPGGPERSFLYSLVRTTYPHHSRTAWRRRKREEAAEPPEPTDRADPERRTLLDRILGRLPADCRRLLERLYFDGATYEELALELTIAVPSVRSRASRCVGKAREFLS